MPDYAIGYSDFSDWNFDYCDYDVCQRKTEFIGLHNIYLSFYNRYNENVVERF